MHKKTIISSTNDASIKRKKLAKTAKQLVVTAEKKEGVRQKLVVTAEKKEGVRRRLVVTAKQLAVIAKERESVRRKLKVLAKEKERVRRKLLVTAKEKERVRNKLVVTAKQLAVTATEKEEVRRKLAVTAKQLAVTAKEKEEVSSKLLTSEKRYRNLFETSKDGILLIDSETEKIINANPHLLGVLGYSLSEIIGKKFWEIGTFRDIEAAKALFKELQTKGSVRYENLPLLTKAGIEIEVEFVSSLYAVGKVKTIQCNIRDITKRKEIAEEIDIVNKDLEAFSYSVSHDLRAPLRAIDGFSKILVEEYAPKIDDEGKRIISTIRQGVDHMEQLINDLLSLSHSGSQPIKTQEIEMGALILAVFKEVKKTVPQRKITLNLGVIPRVKVDPVLMKQVWVNLFSNAIKFTRARAVTVIDISATTADKVTTYAIKDNGVGFDMKYVDKLFQTFQQLHSQKEYGGTGIGLSIIKRIVERHGGYVWAVGKVDQGATFYFTLPAVV